jgi:hypothetical protein
MHIIPVDRRAEKCSWETDVILTEKPSPCCSSVQSVREVGKPGNAATSPTLQSGVKPKRYVAGKQEVGSFLYILYARDSYPADGSSRFQ